MVQVVSRVSLGVVLVPRRLANVLAEGWGECRTCFLQPSADLPQSISLVIGQGVHRVEYECADSVPELSVPELIVQMQQDRVEEGLRLSRGCAGCDDDVPTLSVSFPDGLLLMNIERHLSGYPAEEGVMGRFGEQFLKQSFRSYTFPETRSGLQEGAFAELPRLQSFSEGLTKLRVLEVESSLKVAPISSFDFSGCLNQVHSQPRSSTYLEQVILVFLPQVGQASAPVISAELLATGLALVELNTNIFEYYHKNVEVNKNYNYALAAVDNENREGPPAQTSVQ